MKYKGKQQLIFNVDTELADKFKHYAINKKSNMTELVKEMINKAIELDIYNELKKSN